MGLKRKKQGPNTITYIQSLPKNMVPLIRQMTKTRIYEKNMVVKGHKQTHTYIHIAGNIAHIVQ